MPMMPPINLKAWIEEHRALLKPPVGNKMIWQDSEFMIMAVGGPNQRKDFHVEEGEEFFYQVEGDITLRIIEDGKLREIPIREGEMFLLPPRIPHSPQRPANTIGLVIERVRKEGTLERFQWYCTECHAKVHEVELQVRSLVDDMPPVFEQFHADLDARTCPQCGALHPGKG